MDNVPHYSNEQLIDFLEGRLDALSSTELSKHLESGCQDCNDAMAIYKRMFSAIQTLHWKSPSLNAHRKAIQAYSLKYPVKPKTNWRSIIRPAFIGFTVLVLITFVFLFNLNPGVVYAGYIETVTGQVEMLEPYTGSWNAVTPGQSVPIDASIRSMSESQVTITFPGGEQTILGSESEVHLLSLSESKGSWQITLEQISGQTENLTSQKTHSYSVRTSTGIANSSNGHFVMTIEADGSVVTSVLEGDVETRSHNEKTILHSGETSIIQSEKATKVSPNINHVDPSPNASPEPSQTSTPTLEATTTPKNNNKPTRTPTPTIILPTQESISENPSTLEESSNSVNEDVTCNPGNSNGAGNSENASNSENACK